MTAPKRKTGRPADITVLDESDLTRVKAKAKATVDAERKKAAEAEMLEQALKEERAQYDPDLETVDLMIKLPACDPYVMLDGYRYYHGQEIEVTAAVASSIRDQMARSWEHEYESGNPNMKNYRPVNEKSLSAKSPSAGFSRL